MNGKIKKRMMFALSAAGIAVLAAFPQKAAGGISSAAELCLNTLVPSLFPFLVLSAAAASCCGGAMNGAAGRFLSLVFGLPPCTLPVLLLSLLGGYPTGAAAVKKLFENGEISRREAERAACICFAPGPGFVIGAVGASFMGSPRAGMLLAASVSASVLLGAAATAPISGERGVAKSNVMPAGSAGAAEIINSAINDGAHNMLTVCSRVLIFGAAAALLPQMNGAFGGAVLSLLEITTGLGRGARFLPLPATAALISFGGACVHCQVFSLCSGFSLRFLPFFFQRAVNAAISAGLCLALQPAFPVSAAVSASAAVRQAAAFSSGVPAAASLMFLCIIFILDLDNRKKMCYHNTKTFGQ